MKINLKDILRQLFKSHKIMLVVLIVSIYFVIKCASIPLPAFLKWTGNLFIISEYPSLEIALATGFIASFMVWFLTTFYPSLQTRVKVEEIFISDLSTAVSNIINMLVRLYKNCSTEKEWQDLNIDDDEKLFDGCFEMNISRLDVLAIADSPYMNGDKRITVIEYIKMKFEQFIKLIDYILVSYSSYMYAEEIEIVAKVYQNRFLRNIVGKQSEDISIVFSTESGKFNDDISMLDKFNNGHDSVPLFITTLSRKELMDFVKDVLCLRRMLYREQNDKKSKFIPYNHYFLAYKNGGIGKYNVCCFNEDIRKDAGFSTDDLFFYKDEVRKIIDDINRGHVESHEVYEISELRYNSILESLRTNGFIRGTSIANLNVTTTGNELYQKLL